jgi:hypothetical protein
MEEADIGHDALSNLVATSPESPVPKHTADMATMLRAMCLCHYLQDVARKRDVVELSGSSCGRVEIE